LKDARAQDAVKRLAATADLLVENFRPGVMDRLGLGYDDLRAINPSIVYVTGSGFGPDGPYVDRPGQDLLIQSMSGLAAYGGRRDDPPTPSGTSIVDASTALLLAFSAMVGLFHRERTGEGQRIDVSLFNTAIALQCQELAGRELRGRRRRSAGAAQRAPDDGRAAERRADPRRGDAGALLGDPGNGPLRPTGCRPAHRRGARVDRVLGGGDPIDAGRG